MRFTLVWSDEAENMLADLWVNTTDRQAVADAVDAIERELRIGPRSGALFSRREGSRTIILGPVCVAYETLEEDRIVRIWAVWPVRAP